MDRKSERIAENLAVFCKLHDIGRYDCYELICDVLDSADITTTRTPAQFFNELSDFIVTIYERN